MPALDRDHEIVKAAFIKYVFYEALLQKIEPERIMVLAVPDDILTSLFQDDVGELLIQNGTLRVVGYDPMAAELTQWLLPTTKTDVF